jgi:hypothetical protein
MTLKQILPLALVCTLMFSACNKVRPNIKSIHKALVGDWNVTCQATYGESWNATLSIEENGHYTANVTSGDAISFLDNGDDDLDFPERRIILDLVNDLDYASGTINFMHGPDAMMTYPIVQLTMSSKDNAHFWVGWNGYPKMIEYTMVRQ